METMKKFDEIVGSDLPDIEKLKQTFSLITQSYLTHAEEEIELLKAMGDQENLIKEQIKQFEKAFSNRGQQKHMMGMKNRKGFRQKKM